jgi:putative DNA primase/helicase
MTYVLRKDWAQTFAFFQRQDVPNLIYFREDFYDYDHGRYFKMSEDSVKSRARLFLDRCVVRERAGDGFVTKPFSPTTADDNELANTARRYAIVHDVSANEPPVWLLSPNDQSKMAELLGVATLPAPRDIVVCRNGLLDLSNAHNGNEDVAAAPPRLLKHSPAFFTFNALDFNFDRDAKCPTWLATLGQWWARGRDGAPSKEEMLLQEMFGLFLVPDTSYQKIFAVVGESRGGKGVIHRLLVKLLGNACGSTSAQEIRMPKGHEQVITHLLTIIPEFIIGRDDDPAVITSFLKKVSGEDPISVGRMWATAWYGTLLTRLMLFCNDIPGFRDDSAALAARLVVLRLVESFVNKEDRTLERRLDGEIAGILNWAIIGLYRLRARGTFTMPESSIEARDEIVRGASNVRAFVQDRCDVAETLTHTTEADLYGAYCAWCGGAAVLSKTKFVKSLSAHGSPIRQVRLNDPARTRAFRGVKLTEYAKTEVAQRQAHGAREASNDPLPF